MPSLTTCWRLCCSFCTRRITETRLSSREHGRPSSSEVRPLPYLHSLLRPKPFLTINSLHEQSTPNQKETVYTLSQGSFRISAVDSTLRRLPSPSVSEKAVPLSKSSMLKLLFDCASEFLCRRLEKYALDQRAASRPGWVPYMMRQAGVEWERIFDVSPPKASFWPFLQSLKDVLTPWKC